MGGLYSINTISGEELAADRKINGETTKTDTNALQAQYMQESANTQTNSKARVV